MVIPVVIVVVVRNRNLFPEMSIALTPYQLFAYGRRILVAKRRLGPVPPGSLHGPDRPQR